MVAGACVRWERREVFGTVAVVVVVWWVLVVFLGAALARRRAIRLGRAGRAVVVWWTRRECLRGILDRVLFLCVVLTQLVLCLGLELCLMIARWPVRIRSILISL